MRNNSDSDTSASSSASGAGQSTKQSNPFEPLFAAWLDQCRLWQPDTIADVFGKPEFMERGPASMWPVASVLMQTYVQSLSGSVRFGGRLTEKMARCQAKMIERLAEADAASISDGENMRILIDDARACLREIAEISAEEANNLNTCIQAMDEALRSLAGEAGSDGGGRRWKVKP